MLRRKRIVGMLQEAWIVFPGVVVATFLVLAAAVASFVLVGRVEYRSTSWILLSTWHVVLIPAVFALYQWWKPGRPYRVTHRWGIVAKCIAVFAGCMFIVGATLAIVG